MQTRTLNIATLVLLAVFGVALLDVFVFAPFGARLLPLEYETARTLAVAVGLVAGVVCIAVVRRPRAFSRDFLSRTVPAHVVVVLLLMPIALLSLVGFLGSFSWFMDIFSFFRIQYTAALCVGALILVVLKKPKWALILAPFLLGNLAVMMPYLVRWPRADASGNGPALRLVLANVNAGNRNYEKVASFLRDVDADVILLVEIDAVWREAMSELDERYPHSLTEPRQSSFGIGLWSRNPLRSSEVVAFALDSIPSLVTTIEVEGKSLLVVGTHPIPPRDASNTVLRDTQLERAAAVAKAGGPYSVLLGDLNTTPWGIAFRRIVNGSGLRDSGLGMGIQWTWPTWFWPLALPIDHCLVSEKVQVLDRWTGPDIGSDHYPLVVDIRLLE